MKPLVYALPGNEALGTALATGMDAELGSLQVRRFPDGETYVRLLSDPQGRSVVLACSLDHPDSKSLEVYFAAATARELGATRVGLVAPYLAYMRQDARFNPGEAVTSVHYAHWLSQFIDWMVTVDPHLHRLATLDSIYSIRTSVVSSAPAISGWIAAHVADPLIIGPDAESAQWAERIAQGAGAPCVVLTKQRRGDRDVEVSLPDVSRWPGHTPVVIDDIISTARTMIAAVGQLRAAGMTRAPVCIGVHGLFAGDAHAALSAAGAGEIVTCNTIAHATNRVDVRPHIAQAALELLRSLPA